MSIPDFPDWRTFDGGTVKRVALWLTAEVGEGGIFTKEQLRIALPGVAQVDRRARDLRDEGWVIHTNREDVSLLPGEQRLVTLGGHVWERGYRRQAGKTALGSKERRTVFARDDYCCTLCGISGGETYPDDSVRKAKLTIGRVGGADRERGLVTLCDRCHRGKADVPSAESVQQQIDALDDAQRDQLARWVQTGRRTLSGEEKTWAAYRRLPGDLREALKERILRGDGQH